MNPNQCRTEPLGIEWEFANGVPSIVAHIPGEDGDWECWDVLRAELGNLSPLSRASLRAYLALAQTNLDNSEPARQNAAVSA